MAFVPKLTATAACRVARIDRDRFNEHVAAGRFPCAPDTIPGRARLFDPDDMISLWLFRELMEDGLDAASAGHIACKVAAAAREAPAAQAISYVQDQFPKGGSAISAETVPDPKDWKTFTIGGLPIRKVTTFNVGQLREIIAHHTEEARSIIGPED